MKELEEKVYNLIGKNGKLKTAKMLEINFRTLTSRLDKGGWTKSEEEKINQLSNQ